MRFNLVPLSAIRGRTALWAHVDTPFGRALAAVTGGQLCWLNYPQWGDGLAALEAFWKGGTLAPAFEPVRIAVDRVFGQQENDVTLFLAGTEFQHTVWQALGKIPSGQTLSYGALAARIGRPGAARAVGGAVGANPVILAIPCHRVLAGNGRLHGFGCGLELKARLLEAEGFRAAA